MSNKKQSSVEWLDDKLTSLNFDYLINQMGNKEYNERYKAILEQAKAMHKEEIVNACNLQRNDYKGMPTFNKSGEQYYNETFRGNNEQQSMSI